MALQIETNHARHLVPQNPKLSRNETPLRERPNTKFRIKSELRGATKMPPIASPHLNASVQQVKNLGFPSSKTPLRRIAGKDESGYSQLEENPYGEPAPGPQRLLTIETGNDPRSLISPSPGLSSLTTKNTQLTPIFNNSFTAKSVVGSKPRGFNRRFADMQKSPFALERRNNISESMTSTHERRDISNKVENMTPYSNVSPNSFLPALDPTRCSNKICGPVKAYAANTNQGLVRDYNEDRVAIILNILKPPNVEIEGEWPMCSFFGIYDGHGGAECADFLRDNLHQLIIRDKNFPYNPEEALRNGFREAERQFLDMAQKQHELNKSGSCAIVALIVNDTCYIANVGDSRAVMSSDRGKKAVALSRDHKPNEDYEKERIVANGGRIYQSQISMPMKPRSLLNSSAYTKTVLGPHRVFPGRLSVSRTFGDIEAKNPKYGGMPGVVVAEPDIMSYKLTSDNDFIVIACDGIFDKMTDDDVVKAAWEPTRTKCRDLHQQSCTSVENILMESMIRKTFDNITAVMISLEGFKKAMFPNDTPDVLERKGSASPTKLTVDMLLEKTDNEASRLQASPLYNTLKRTLDASTNSKEMKKFGFGESQQNAEADAAGLSATLRGGPPTQKIGEDGMLNFSIKRLSGTSRKAK